jgi:hypothetical protein
MSPCPACLLPDSLCICCHICDAIFPQANLEDTALLASNHTDLPAHVLKELSTKSETVTPWWWGLKTLIKVSHLGACWEDN